MAALPHFSTTQFTAALLVSLLARPAAEFRVQVDKENILAGSIEGVWVSDAALNERLGARASNTRLEITRDDSIASKIPDKYAEFLGKKQIYAAGTIVWEEGDRQPSRTPMIVVEYSGNPHLVTFRPRDSEPLGDAESGNVMLVRAKDRTHDLLFLGGDTARESFQAFRREISAPK